MTKSERIAQLEEQLGLAMSTLLKLQARVTYLEGQTGIGPYVVPTPSPWVYPNTGTPPWRPGEIICGVAQ